MMPKGMTSAELVGMGWTILGPSLETVDGEEAWVIRVDEFPGFLVVEDTREAAMSELQPAMKAWLDGAIDLGIPIPQPSSPLRVTIVSSSAAKRSVKVSDLLGRDLAAEKTGQSTRGAIGMQPA